MIGFLSHFRFWDITVFILEVEATYLARDISNSYIPFVQRFYIANKRHGTKRWICDHNIPRVLLKQFWTVLVCNAAFRQKALTPNFSKTFCVQIFVRSFFLPFFTILFRVSLEKWYFLGRSPMVTEIFSIFFFVFFAIISYLQFFENMELNVFS